MKIAVMAGDGIGPEIMAEALKVLAVLRHDGLKIETETALVGGAACTTDGLGAKQGSIGTRYNFSKRFSIFGMYSRINNDFAARYNNMASGSLSSGADITHLAIGMQHAF